MIIARDMVYRTWGRYTLEINEEILEEVNKLLLYKAMNPKEIPLVTEDTIRELIKRDCKSNPDFWNVNLKWKGCPWDPSSNSFYEETFAKTVSEIIYDLMYDGDFEEVDQECIDGEPISLFDE